MQRAGPSADTGHSTHDAFVTAAGHKAGDRAGARPVSRQLPLRSCRPPCRNAVTHWRWRRHVDRRACDSARTWSAGHAGTKASGAAGRAPLRCTAATPLAFQPMAAAPRTRDRPPEPVRSLREVVCRSESDRAQSGPVDATLQRRVKAARVEGETAGSPGNRRADCGSSKDGARATGDGVEPTPHPATTARCGPPVPWPLPAAGARERSRRGGFTANREPPAHDRCLRQPGHRAQNTGAVARLVPARADPSRWRGGRVLLTREQHLRFETLTDRFRVQRPCQTRQNADGALPERKKHRRVCGFLAKRPSAARSMPHGVGRFNPPHGASEWRWKNVVAAHSLERIAPLEPPWRECHERRKLASKLTAAAGRGRGRSRTGRGTGSSRRDSRRTHRPRPD